MPPAIVPEGKSFVHGIVADELFSLSTRDRIGLEVEVFLTTREGRRDIPDPVRNSFYRALAREFGGELSYGADGDPVLTLPDGGGISFEPAGQLEYSGPPFDSALDASLDALEFLDRLERVAISQGILLAVNGYDDALDEPPLVVAKARYVAMDKYFRRVGPYGRMMMRRTCALQINLDFGGIAVNQQRWRLANMISPALNALFANSPTTFEGRHYRSFRYEIWKRADPTRTGRLFDRPDLDPVADYVRFALDARVMFIRMDDGSCLVPAEGLTFRQWMSDGWGGRYPRSGDWRRHLTTLFPDIRPRGWMEVRSIDAQSREMIGVVTSVVASSLYDRSIRSELLRMLEDRHRRASDDGEHDGCWISDLRAGIAIARAVAHLVPLSEWRGRLDRHVQRISAAL